MTRLSLHHTGQCRHPEWSTRRDRSLRPCSFPMHAAVIDRGGDLTVFDPGYAPRFMTATSPFPERLYRWMTPTDAPASSALAAQLGDRRAAVTTVVISHFHADHVAGLADFPQARIVCARGAWQHFRALSGFSAVRAGYLKSLIPDWVEDRLTFADDLPARPLPPGFAPMRDGRDLHGDGSVLLMPLPGHSVGQMGAALTGADGIPRLLIADASWSVPALRDDAPPPGLTLRLIGSAAEFRETWGRLRALMAQNPGTRLIACHCAASAQGEACGHP
ncbi:MBL fold metallo-hydrolase [Neotabrizicola sp. VNH66]|uniref:MBL fold metallo-hydrolase n=1 Tax=Neotabrizicola sp. VNH66 TaxID=3400918 RepID=UPI003C046DCB